MGQRVDGLKRQNPFSNRGLKERANDPSVFTRRKRGVVKDKGVVTKADLDYIRKGLHAYDSALQMVTCTFLEVRGEATDRHLQICVPSKRETAPRNAVLFTFNGSTVSKVVAGPCFGLGWQGRMLDEVIHKLKAGLLNKPTT